MKKIIFIFGLVISSFIFSCNKDMDDCMGTAVASCTCPQVLAPVCGCNRVTYDNGCLASCAGVKSYTSGACP